jgi:sugar lactone lactonase YvrE
MRLRRAWGIAARIPFASSVGLSMGLLAMLSVCRAEEPVGDLAKKLAATPVEFYAEAPGYSEGPTWRNGEVFFCSGGLLRVDAERRVTKYLDIGAAGTFLRANGHLLVCDNKYLALLDVAPDGKVGVVADQFEGKELNSLNDLTVDKAGNIYWTDPSGSSSENPVGNIFRVTPAGTISKVATGLAFPNGLDVDPASEFLYVIESQSQKVLRYPVPKADQPLAKPTVFYDLGGSGGDGCAFDADGNLWVADFHRKDTAKGRITVLSPEAKVLGYLNLPSKVVSNIAFGGPELDEVYCTTGEPPGVFRAKVGVKGFRGHPAPDVKILRLLDLKPAS